MLLRSIYLFHRSCHNYFFWCVLCFVCCVVDHFSPLACLMTSDAYHLRGRGSGTNTSPTQITKESSSRNRNKVNEYHFNTFKYTLLSYKWVTIILNLYVYMLKQIPSWMKCWTKHAISKGGPAEVMQKFHMPLRVLAFVWICSCHEGALEVLECSSTGRRGRLIAFLSTLGSSVWINDALLWCRSS